MVSIQFPSGPSLLSRFDSTMAQLKDKTTPHTTIQLDFLILPRGPGNFPMSRFIAGKWVYGVFPSPLGQNPQIQLDSQARNHPIPHPSHRRAKSIQK